MARANIRSVAIRSISYVSNLPRVKTPNVLMDMRLLEMWSQNRGLRQVSVRVMKVVRIERETQYCYPHFRKSENVLKYSSPFYLIIFSDSNGNGYRIRISGFPPNVTPMDILKRLNVNFARINDNLCLRKESVSSSQTIAYLIDQTWPYLVAELIRQWHHQPFSASQPDVLHCQLELNVDYFDLAIQVDIPSVYINGSQTSARTSNASCISSTSRKLHSKRTESAFQRLKNNNLTKHQYTDASPNNSSGRIELPKHLSSWLVTSTRLWNYKNDDTIEVYYAMNKKEGEEKNGAYIRWLVSDAKLRRRFQHYQTVLETLKGQ